MKDNECVPLDLNAHFVLREGAAEKASGLARLRLTEDSLGLMPETGQARSYPLREILDVRAADYRLALSLPEGHQVVLSQLGRDFDNLARELSTRRSALLLSDLLMEEPLVMGGMKGDYRQVCPGAEPASGQAELRLYQTALVVIPQFGTPVRLPFSEILESGEADCKFSIKTEFNGEFVFSSLGRDLEPLKRNLNELSRALALKVQSLVKELMPSAGQAAVLKLAGLMKEGRAARRRDIEAEAPGLWGELELRLLDSPAAEEYAFLKKAGRSQDISIGVKRSLEKGESDYLWFLVPVASIEHRKPGNAVVMEAVSEDDEARATYVFRLVSRAAYTSLKTEA